MSSLPVEGTTLELLLDNPLDAGELAADEDDASSPDKIHRRLLQTNEYASGLLYKVELQQVSYAIKVSLADATQPTKPADAPRIAKIAPLWAKGREATRQLSASTQQALSLGSAGMTPQLHIGQEGAVTTDQTRAAEVVGYIAPHHPRRHSGVMNRILWNVVENEANQNGIPPFFRGAMIVVATPPSIGVQGQAGERTNENHMKPFLMHMQVEVTQRFLGTRISFTRRSGANTRPVRFAPDLSFRGNAQIASDFGLLTLEDWVKPPQPGFMTE